MNPNHQNQKAQNPKNLNNNHKCHRVHINKRIYRIKSKVLKLIREWDFQVFLTDQIEFYYVLLRPVYETTENVKFSNLDQFTIDQTDVCWDDYAYNKSVKNHLKGPEEYEHLFLCTNSKDKEQDPDKDQRFH